MPTLLPVVTRSTRPRRFRPILVLPFLLVLLLLVAFRQLIHQPSTTPSSSPELATKTIQLGRKLKGQLIEPHICFVIRTYWGDGPRGSDSLEQLLRFIKRSGYTRWQALLLVVDSKPFTELKGIVQQLSDPRIHIYANKVGEEYAAKLPDGSNWNPEYHGILYNLTDDAIAACSNLTQWVVVTNADNEYDPKFLTTVASTPADVGVVAFDFYSRYQRPTARPCDRFVAGPAHPICKQNLVRFCQTDLAANVLNWPSFIAEQRGFGKLPSARLGINDGLMAEQLMAAGWKVRAINTSCLVSHSPNPQLCSLRDGVWDDSGYDSYAASGGRCISKVQAKQLIAGHPELEVVHLALSHDPAAFVRTGDARRLQDAQCIRRVLPPGWSNTFYPAVCAAPLDAQ